MSDLLLEWLSFRRSGRLADIPAELLAGVAPRRLIDDLATLAHVEVSGKDKWSVASPVLAGLPGPSTGAVLCGARTAGVMSRLATACSEHGGHISMTEVLHRPSEVRVTTDSLSVLNAIARGASIRFQPDAGFTLLSCTPMIRQWPSTPCAMVIGRVQTVRRFSRRKLGWVDTTLDAAHAARSGFFRIQRDYDWVSILKKSGAESALIDDRAGRLAAASKLRALTWDSASNTLRIPNQLPPPTLIARALALCSGSLPAFDRASRQLSFREISFPMVQLASAITGLRLQ